VSSLREDAQRESDAVARQVSAYNRRDLDSFLDCYAPDAVIENVNGDALMEGHAAIRAAYGELFAGSPELHVEIATRIRIGEYVIDEEVVTGRRESPEATRVAAIYHVRDGAIDRVRLIR
jgi:uncharacterized protein (TIGR02246 family)